MSEEEELYRHYGLTRNTRGNLGDGSGTNAPTTAGTGTMGAAGTGAAAGAGAGAGAGAMGAAGTGRHRDTDTAGTGAGRPLAGAGAGAMRSGAETGGKEEMIRSEEQLHIGTEEYESGRARLHKYVVTENVTRTVPVSHEEVRVVREPVRPDDRTAVRGDLTEQDMEVTLHAERATMRKETVPVERVRMETQKVTEQKEVSAELRKEQIDYADGTTKGGKDMGGPDMGGKDTGGEFGRGRRR